MNSDSDFFETKHKNIKRAESVELDVQKLRVISSFIGGEIGRHNGQVTECINSENTCV
ncbi:MAG: hypothetical protein L6Q37_06820 [Bdellovibrionaceae bacterium]|nr:hypothetical protein [Pseudobdellovibrionaceae bacterium]NUM59003.1 hypothetical protein [Pseudobdellovibrionaceae bacterium]